MSAKTIAWSISAVSSAGVALGFALLLLAPDPPPALADPVRSVVPVASMATFAITGHVIVSRWPANPIGWIFCAAGFINGLQTAAGGYVAFGLSRALPGSLLAAWVFAWIGMILVGMLAIFPLLLFPRGSLPSPRWRPVAVAGAVGIALATAAFALVPGRLAISGAADNPFGLTGAGAANAIVEAGSVGAILVVVGVIAAAASIGVRLTRARGDERQQLKVVVVAGAALACAFVSIPALGLSAGEARLSLGPAFAVLAGAIVLAILRFRLYDIDLLIRRTVVFGSVSIVLTATYVAFVLIFQTVLKPLTSGNELAVAGSTLLVVALFQPLRSRIQDAVDRRFYRSRYDAVRTLDAFGARLRDEVDLDALRGELVGVVRDTMEPANVSVWLRERA